MFLKTWFCDHKWAVIKTTVAAPIYGGRIANVEDDTVRYLSQGSTSYLVQCEKCSKLTTHVHAGAPAKLV
jgi:hypothetical protein